MEAETKLSMRAALRAVRRGRAFSVSKVAEKAGVKKDSVRTVIRACNSRAPSDAPWRKTGMRFRMPRGADRVERLH